MVNGLKGACRNAKIRQLQGPTYKQSSTMNDASSKLIAALFAEQKELTVGELTERIKDLLEGEFFALQVLGEISNYKRHSSGHWYFTLKDSEAQLRAVFFKQWNRLMRFEPENGLEVRTRGRLGVYEPRGEYQIIVETMEPVGVGALQLAFEQQVRKLAAEGLFDETRKRSLPMLPSRIGIVTSPVGAAIRDMLQILERRNPNINVVITPVKVQGTGAGREIADAIRLLNRHSAKSGDHVDVIVIGRGGGSMEDLWAFNEEQVARAIYDSEIPVVSAVGHETDFTIADLVADMRAPTPSAAIEMVVRESSELRERISRLHAALKQTMIYYLLRRQSTLRELVESPGFTQTVNLIQSATARCRDLQARAIDSLKFNLGEAKFKIQFVQNRLAVTDLRLPLALKVAQAGNLEQRAFLAIRRMMEKSQNYLAVNSGKLDMLSPLSVLGRGYALVKDDTDHLVLRAAGLSEGQHLRVRFEDGEVGCQVTKATS